LLASNQSLTAKSFLNSWTPLKVAVGITTNDKPGYLTSKYGFDKETPLAVLNDTDYHDPVSTPKDWRGQRAP
jgi:hypothetical protein